MRVRQRIGMFGVPVAVIVLVVPLPSFLLDLLISINISAALIVLFMTMHVDKARDFSGFPLLLLIATIFRLAINVSVARLVLLQDDACAVVESFRNLAIGGQRNSSLEIVPRDGAIAYTGIKCALSYHL